MSVSTDTSILHHSARLMAQRGYHGTSMRDIAAAVGLQMASLYHHFASKQDLLVVIMRTAMHELTGRVSDAVEQAGPSPTDRLAAAIKEHVRVHVESRPEMIVTDAELRSLEAEGRGEIIALRDAHTRLFREPITEMGVSQPGVIASAVITMCTDVALWFRPDGALDVDGVADTFVTFTLHGVAGRPTS